MLLRQRLLSLGPVLALPMVFTGLVHPVVGVVMLIGSLALATWLVPGFWSVAIAGAVGGALAGVAILGVGWRLAMRVVAILDPGRVPGFTMEGTLFILLVLGAMGGGILGAVGALLTSGRGTARPALTGLLPGGLAMLVLLLSEEQRTELFELGAGPWLNLPMFAGVAYLYGLVAMNAAKRIEKRLPGVHSRDPRAEVRV